MTTTESRAPRVAAPASARGEASRFRAVGHLQLSLMLSFLLAALFIARTAFVVDGELYFALFDDGMISMRYARNLAQGHGLVWNPGESPIEGYTNFLWVLWMAVLHMLPIAESKISLLVMVSGALLLAANLLVVRRLAEKVCGDSPVASATAVVLTALYYPLVFWTLRGMEVGLLTLLVNIGLLATVSLFERFRLQDLLVLTCVLVLAILTRPDAVIPFGIIGFFLAIGSRPGYRLLTIGTLGLAFAATLGGQTLFRIAYYGDALPNTYYLKMKGAPAVERIQVGLNALRDVILFHLFAPIILAVPALRRVRYLPVLLLASVFLVQGAYSVYVGGDAWEYMKYANRYITIGMPALFVLCGLAVHSLVYASRAQLARFVLVALALLTITLVALSVAMLGGETSSHGGAVIMGRYSLARLVIGVGALLTGGILGLFVLRARAGGQAGRWMTALVERLAVRPAVVLVGLVLIVMNGPAWGKWVVENAEHLGNDIAWSRVGLQVRESTTADASIAVVGAGAIPYYSHRRAFDLLGKNDPVIAHQARRMDVPEEYLHPGHDKWDYRYSIGTFRPDLIVQLWYPSAEDRRYFESQGYQELPNGMYLRKGSGEVRADQLVSN